MGRADRFKITDASVARLHADPDKSAKGHDTLIPDGSLVGFCVKITPRGSKSYIYNYRRLSDRRSRRITIGSANKMSASAARKEADRLAREVANGRDPAAEKSAARIAPDFASVSEFWLADFEFMVRTGSRSRKTLEEYRSKLKNHLIPALGKTKLADLTPRDFRQLRNRLLQSGVSKTSADGVLRAASAMMSWAKSQELIDANPARELGQFQAPRRQRFLSPPETVRLGAVLARWQTRHPIAVAAIRLALLTGMRRSNILSLRWDQIDLHRQLVVLDSHKAKNRTQQNLEIPLSVAAIDVLNQAQAWRRSSNPFVFPTQIDRAVHMKSQNVSLKRMKGHFVGLSKIWARIRAEAGLDDVRFHDLRHTHAATAASSGLSLPLVGALLGHSSPAATQRYAHLQPSAKSAAAEAISVEIARLLDQGTDEATANVVDLTRREPQ